MWVQRAQKKQLATGANAQKKKKATPNIVQTPHGRTFRVMDVKGGGRCGLLALYATKNVAQGTPYDKVSSQVFPDNGEGEISAELEDTVQSIRDAVAQVPDSDLGDLRDGEESRDLEHVLKDTFHEIETKNMFRSVVLMADGYVDPLAMRLAARHLEMDGLRVVRLLGGVLVPADYHESKELPDTDVPLVWYDGHGHFKALIPWTSVSTDCVSWCEVKRGRVLAFLY